MSESTGRRYCAAASEFVAVAMAEAAHFPYNNTFLLQQCSVRSRVEIVKVNGSSLIKLLLMQSRMFQMRLDTGM